MAEESLIRAAALQELAEKQGKTFDPEVFAAFPRMESEARLGLQQIKPKHIFWAVFGALWAFGITGSIVAAIAIEILR